MPVAGFVVQARVVRPNASPHPDMGHFQVCRTRPLAAGTARGDAATVRRQMVPAHLARISLSDGVCGDHTKPPPSRISLTCPNKK